jgi:DNA polymerase epsilon subunit 2
MGALNYFGGVSNAGEQAPLGRLEIDDEGAMFVVVSDVWLDKPAVLDRLRMMFDGYATMEPPPIFVLMGNFLSQPYGADTNNVFKGAFDTLCDLICTAAHPSPSLPTPHLPFKLGIQF